MGYMPRMSMSERESEWNRRGISDGTESSDAQHRE